MPLDMDMAMAPFRYMLGDETNNVLDRMSSRTGGCGGGGGQGADSDDSDGSGHTVNGDLGGDLADPATGYDPENDNEINIFFDKKFVAAQKMTHHAGPCLTCVIRSHTCHVISWYNGKLQHIQSQGGLSCTHRPDKEERIGNRQGWKGCCGQPSQMPHPRTNKFA